MDGGMDGCSFACLCRKPGGGGGEIDGSVTDRQIDRQKDS